MVFTNKRIYRLCLFMGLTSPLMGMFSSLPSAAEEIDKAGEAFVNGMMRGVGNAVGAGGAGKAIGKAIVDAKDAIMQDAKGSTVVKDVVRTVADQGFEGMGEAFKQGGKNDEMFAELQGLIKRRFGAGGDTDQAADEIAGGVGRASGRVADEIRKNLASNGAIGRAANEASKLVWGNLYGRPIAYTVAGFLGIATSVYGSRVLWNYVERLLLTPKVITEYYKKSWFTEIKNYFGMKTPSPEMIFPKVLKDRLNDLIEETKAIRAAIMSGTKGIQYRNILLYGPPGTGKTMFAKKFAHESGMDFAFIPGASLFQKGAGIKVVQELFAWAKKSKNGLVIFIDEADALFIDRATMNQSDENYGTLNYLLTELGEASDKFVVIATTNYHTRFDKTMIWRSS
jgi:hypothetical protein